MHLCPLRTTSVLMWCCTGGDLCAAICADTNGSLRWYERGHRIALDIARGLYFLHSHEVSGTLSTHAVSKQSGAPDASSVVCAVSEM